MGIDPMNNITIIIRILFAVTLFQQKYLFSMGIWRKKFICNSHRGMRSKGRRIWYAS
jgi:hypothetical protein